MKYVDSYDLEEMCDALNLVVLSSLNCNRDYSYEENNGLYQLYCTYMDDGKKVKVGPEYKSMRPLHHYMCNSMKAYLGTIKDKSEVFFNLLHGELNPRLALVVFEIKDAVRTDALDMIKKAIEDYSAIISEKKCDYDNKEYDRDEILKDCDEVLKQAVKRLYKKFDKTFLSPIRDKSINS